VNNYFEGMEIFSFWGRREKNVAILAIPADGWNSFDCLFCTRTSTSIYNDAITNGPKSSTS
jgi:hypothetical protein